MFLGFPKFPLCMEQSNPSWTLSDACGFSLWIILQHLPLFPLHFPSGLPYLTTFISLPLSGHSQSGSPTPLLTQQRTHLPQDSLFSAKKAKGFKWLVLVNTFLVTLKWTLHLCLGILWKKAVPPLHLLVWTVMSTVKCILLLPSSKFYPWQAYSASCLHHPPSHTVTQARFPRSTVTAAPLLSSGCIWGVTCTEESLGKKMLKLISAAFIWNHALACLALFFLPVFSQVSAGLPWVTYTWILLSDSASRALESRQILCSIIVHTLRMSNLRYRAER